MMKYCEDYLVEVLGIFDSYKATLKAEKEIQIMLDVVASPEYYNKSIANESTFTDPTYATYKHTITGKVARLPRNHLKVLSGEWVGVTKGAVLSEEIRKKLGRSGKENGFYGKKHTEETKQKSGKKIGDFHRGKPKSVEQRKKMSESAKRIWADRKENNTNRKEGSV